MSRLAHFRATCRRQTCFPAQGCLQVCKVRWVGHQVILFFVLDQAWQVGAAVCMLLVEGIQSEAHQTAPLTSTGKPAAMAGVAWCQLVGEPLPSTGVALRATQIPLLNC